MPRTKAAPVRFATFGDVLRHLKGIHPRRIPTSPSPGTATVRDVIRLDRKRHEGGVFELVDGVLVAKVGGFWEAVVAGRIIYPLQTFQARHDLGVVVGAGGLMQLGPRLVRAPTVSFVSWDQLPGRAVPRQPVPRIHPDLAVEILCPGNTTAELARKRRDYFAAGTRLVWQVDWRSRTVNVYTAPDEFTTLAESGTLDGGDVLPGFTLPVRSIFVNQPPAGPKRKKRR
jgi:Uma2 family endonuclease